MTTPPAKKDPSKVTLEQLQFKKITAYTTEELDFAVKYAVENHPGFYDLLRGIDAYLERRKRKDMQVATAVVREP